MDSVVEPEVGYTLSEVVDVLLGEYDSGGLDYKTTVRLIDACADIVCENDGNTSEMFETMTEEGRCGTCLKKGRKVFWIDWKKVKETQEFPNLDGCICEKCAKKYDVPVIK